MTHDNIYWEPEQLSKERIVEVLAYSTNEEKEKALISLVFSELDLDFTKKIIFEHAENSDEAIKGTAILCIGHMARIFGSLPEAETVKIIMDGLKSNSKYVKEQSEAALDDIEIFMPDLGKKIHSFIEDRPI